MTAKASRAEDLFQSIAKRYDTPPVAKRNRGFGSGALKVNGKIFAALSNGKLLLKLPKARVDALVESKVGERFSTGAARIKKEWITIAPSFAVRWRALTREAYNFVRAESK